MLCLVEDRKVSQSHFFSKVPAASHTVDYSEKRFKASMNEMIFGTIDLEKATQSLAHLLMLTLLFFCVKTYLTMSSILALISTPVRNATVTASELPQYGQSFSLIIL